MKRSIEDRNYIFDRLYNCSFTQDLDDFTIKYYYINHGFMCKTGAFKHNEALRRIKSRKTFSLEEIPIEI